MGTAFITSRTACVLVKITGDEFGNLDNGGAIFLEPLMILHDP